MDDLYPSQQQTRDVFKDVLNERVAQEAKWGQQDHVPPWYYLILAEEVGEVAKTILEGKSVYTIRTELIQVAAVAVAMVESMDRKR